MNHENKVEAVEEGPSRIGDLEAGTNTGRRHGCGDTIPAKFNAHIYDNLLVHVEQQIESWNRKAVRDPNPEIAHALWLKAKAWGTRFDCSMPSSPSSENWSNARHWEREAGLRICRMSSKAAGRALIPMGLQCSMPRFVTIYATVPGKILRFCQNCWHKPTPTSACQGSAFLMRSAEGQTSFLMCSGERPAHERSSGLPSARRAIWSWYRSA